MQPRSPDTPQSNADRRRYALYLAPIGAALLWHAATVLGLVTWHTLDAPAAALADAGALIMSDALAHQKLMALLQIGAGLATGFLTGAALAMLSKPGPLQMLRPLPFLGLAPLLVLLSGMPHAPNIALIALSTACPVYFVMFSKIHGTRPVGEGERQRVLF